MKKIKPLFIITLLFLLSACQKENNYTSLNGHTMGTTYRVTLEQPSTKIKPLKNLIDQKLDKINQLMSTYINDSELSKFNALQSTECQKLSKETLFVIKSAVNVANQTQGKFDVTLAPLIEIWGFDKKNTKNKIPSQTVITNLLKQTGSNKLHFGTQCIAKESPNLSVNLSAIAKGYAVDEIAKLIHQQGINNYLVEIGGEVANMGVNVKGKPWTIAIESASSKKRSIQKVIMPKGLGIATSGDYRNYFEKDGKRYSHTINPTSGYPITHALASITVLHHETMLADAYATAMMAMGSEDSLNFANKHKVPIFMLVKTENGFKEVYNELFKSYIQ